MVRSIRRDSENKTLSFFPAPYPDECYYSVLCRYMVHSGLPSTANALLELFGREIGPASTLMMPYMSGSASRWAELESGITEDVIVREHTAYHYFSIVYRKKEAENLLDRMRNGKKCGCRMNYRSSLATSGLRYCPMCAYEEKVDYGEMYWHRTHQLKGVRYCTKHRIELADSGITLRKIKRSFVPASFALGSLYKTSLEELGCKRKPVSYEYLEKYKAVERDLTWLMKHGDSVQGLEHVIARYEDELHKRKLTDDRYKDRITEMKLLKESFTEYHGGGFLKELEVGKHEFLEWKSAPSIVARFLSPLEHVLMMEFLCGSVPAFFGDK